MNNVKSGLQYTMSMNCRSEMIHIKRYFYENMLNCNESKKKKVELFEYDSVSIIIIDILY